MSLKKAVFCFCVVLIFCLTASTVILAESRKIYVGDIITVEIETHLATEEEVYKGFIEFEIVDYRATKDFHYISVRCFNPGDYAIFFGAKELVISVSSTLEEYAKETLYDGSPTLSNNKFQFHWYIILAVIAAVFVVSAFILTEKYIKYKKTHKKSDYQIFLDNSAKLSTISDNYLVDLTYFFKKYIESINKRKIIGKTSEEIISELRGFDFFSEFLTEINLWLTECDLYKFSGMDTSEEIYQKLYENLKIIAEKIELKNSAVEGSVEK